MSDPVDGSFGAGLAKIRMVVELLSLSGVGDVSAIAPLLHPEMRVVAAPGIAPTQRLRTRDELLAFFAESRSRGLLISPDASRICLSRSGAVFVEGRICITSAAGADVVPAWFVYTIRDGLIASLETHLDRDLALRAAGIVDDA